VSKNDLTRWNRSGLSRLQYVNGNAATYLDEIRAALNQKFPYAKWDKLEAVDEAELEEQEHEEWIQHAKNKQLIEQYLAERGNIGWEMVRSFARSCHVLTTQMDAHANEAYLRTATQWDYVRKMVSMLDYHPVGATSATTFLAIKVREKRKGKIEKGLQVRHRPLSGDKPIVFETLEDLDADYEFNEFQIEGWNISQKNLIDAEKTPNPNLSPWVESNKARIRPDDSNLIIENNQYNDAEAAWLIEKHGNRVRLEHEGVRWEKWKVGEVRLKSAPRFRRKPWLNGEQVRRSSEPHGISTGSIIAWRERVEPGESQNSWKLSRVTNADAFGLVIEEDNWPPWGAENERETTPVSLKANIEIRLATEVKGSYTVPSDRLSEFEIVDANSPSLTPFTMSDIYPSAVGELPTKLPDRGDVGEGEIASYEEMPHDLKAFIQWLFGALGFAASFPLTPDILITLGAMIKLKDSRIPSTGQLVFEAFLDLFGGSNNDKEWDFSNGNKPEKPTLFRFWSEGSESFIPSYKLKLIPFNGSLPEEGSNAVIIKKVEENSDALHFRIFNFTGLKEFNKSEQEILETLKQEIQEELQQELENKIREINALKVQLAPYWNGQTLSQEITTDIINKVGSITNISIKKRPKFTENTGTLWYLPKIQKGQEDDSIELANQYDKQWFFFNGKPTGIKEGDWAAAKFKLSANEERWYAVRVEAIENIKVPKPKSSEPTNPLEEDEIISTEPVIPPERYIHPAAFALRLKLPNWDDNPFNDKYDLPEMIEFQADFRHEGEAEGAAINETGLGDAIRLTPCPKTLSVGRLMLAVNGEGKTQKVRVSEVNTEELEPCSVKLTPPLSEHFKQGNLKLFGNVVQAGHGERQPSALLGTGTGALRPNHLILESKETSTIPDRRLAGGAREDLTVRIGDEQWHQVAHLNQSESTDRHFMVKTTEEGFLKLQFGDDRQGRMPPPGLNNVRINYRLGAGRRGGVPAGSLEQLVQPHPLVESVQQPFEAIGGSDMELPEHIRERAPASLLALERAVSITDFEQLAMQHRSVWQARAFYHIGSAGRRDKVEVVIALVDGKMPDFNMREEIADYLQQRAVPTVKVEVVSYLPREIEINIDIRVDYTTYEADKVVIKVRKAIAETFSASRRGINQALHLSEIYAAVEQVPGVEDSICTFEPNVAAINQQTVVAETNQIVFIPNEDAVTCRRGEYKP